MYIYMRNEGLIIPSNHAHSIAYMFPGRDDLTVVDAYVMAGNLVTGQIF